MKNQYFGDVNDFQKYGVLRALAAGNGIRSAVCWALTPDCESSDGSRIGYLSDEVSWKRRDPEVFEALRREVLDRGARSVHSLERSGLIENSCYWTHTLPETASERNDYFARFLDFARGAELVFLDPDNGLEVKSCPPGTSNSRKYIYWSEIRAIWSRGHSILVYQHFPRVQRVPYVRELARAISDATAAECVISFRASTVVFLLVAQGTHLERLTKNLGPFMDRWSGVFKVEWHRFIQSGPRERTVASKSSVQYLSASAAFRAPKSHRAACRLATPRPG